MKNKDQVFTLKRLYFNEEYTLGKLYLNGQFICDILEDKDRDTNTSGKFDNGEVKVAGKTAIPYGKYEVILTNSPRFKRVLPELLNVPHFTGIRIHAGNTADDSEGCLLPGLNKDKGKVLESKVYESKIIELIRNYKGLSYIDIVKG